MAGVVRPSRDCNKVGLRQSHLDPCLWLPPKSDTECLGCCILIYVDDFKKHHNDNFISRYWKPLTKLLTFKSTEEKQFSFLGMQQDYSKPGIATFSQAEFIRRIEDCPVPKGAKAEDLADAATVTAYRGTLGAMQY